jgi:two-component system, NtrC family, sensor kinase
MPTTAPPGTPRTQQRPGYAHHKRTVRVLRLLQLASIALPIMILAAGGRLAWLTEFRDASDETDRIVDLVYESTSKLFEAQLLALEQVRLTIAPLDDSAIAANEHELHDRLAAMLRHLPHLRDLYFITRYGHSGVDATRYPTAAANDVTGRDYFQYFRNGGTELYIGLPGKRIMDNLGFVPLAIARAGSGEPFDGVISSSVNPDFFEGFFRRVLAG